MGRSQVSHHRSNSRGLRHCASGDEMVLICHMILKDHVTKALKFAITIFSKVHGMSYSHIRNFTITGALTKTFSSAFGDSSLILVRLSWVTNDEIYAKSVTGRKKRKNKKGNCKAFCVTRKCKKFTEIIHNIHYIMCQRPKCQIIQFFSGNSHSGDNHGGTFTTSNISFHLTEALSHLKNVLKI